MKKLFSLLLVLALVVSCLTGCVSTTKIKVNKNGKVTGSTVLEIKESEYKAYCKAAFAGEDETEEDAEAGSEEDEEFDYDESDFDTTPEEDETQAVDFDTYYAESVEGLLDEGYKAATDDKGNTVYRLKKSFKKSKKNKITATYCEIKDYITSDYQKSINDFSAYADSMDFKLQITFPYKGKSSNGTISSNKKTVTWDLMEMKAKKATLKAYTEKYKK